MCRSLLFIPDYYWHPMISLLHKTWHVLEPSPEVVNLLVKELGVSPIVAGLLVNRKVTTANEARYSLDADLTKLHDPF
jgi:single-stranded-DNA-specific exonuclease